jgi:hypothetical protein
VPKKSSNQAIGSHLDWIDASDDYVDQQLLQGTVRSPAPGSYTRRPKIRRNSIESPSEANRGFQKGGWVRNESPKDFFISYNHNDRSWAEWIAWVLEENGFTTIIQAWDFRPGSNFALEMKNGLERALRVLAVLSPNYLSSKFAQAEWAAAFARDPTGEKGILVPVRVAAVELVSLDATIIYIDLVSKGEAESQSELLNGIKAVRIKPASKPAFPGLSKPRFPGSPLTEAVPARRGVKPFLLLCLLFVAAIMYYWTDYRSSHESALDPKSTPHETGAPAAAAGKKPVGTLTLKEEHQ